MGIVTLLLLTACSESPNVSATVVDVWSKPVADATILQEGVTERPTTNAQGRVDLVVPVGNARFIAGADGYIKDLQTITVEEDMDDPIAVRFTLFPEPQSPGFYGVGDSSYIPLQQLKVKAISTELTTYVGFEEIPGAALSSAGNRGARFVYNSTLRPEEISRFDLRLSKLAFKPEVDVTGVLGETTVKLNLWVAQADVDYDIQLLQSKNDYLMSTKMPLEPGVYAFHAQGILNPAESEALDRLPEELRVAYPFEIK